MKKSSNKPQPKIISLSEMTTDQLWERVASLHKLIGKQTDRSVKADIKIQIEEAISYATGQIRENNPDLVHFEKKQREEALAKAKAMQKANQAFYQEVTTAANQFEFSFKQLAKEGERIVAERSVELINVHGTFTKNMPNIEVRQPDGSYKNKRDNSIAELRSKPVIMNYNGKEGKKIMFFIGAIIANAEDIDNCKPRSGFSVIENKEEGAPETFTTRGERQARKQRLENIADSLQS